MAQCSGSDPTGETCTEQAMRGLSLCRHCLAEERYKELAARVAQLELRLASRTLAYYPR